MQRRSTVRTISRPMPGTWRKTDGRWMRLDVDLRRTIIAAEDVIKEVRHYSVKSDGYILDRAIRLHRKAARTNDPSVRRTIIPDAHKASRRLRLEGAAMMAAAKGAPVEGFMYPTIAVAWAITVGELTLGALAAAHCDDDGALTEAEGIASKAREALSMARSTVDRPDFTRLLTEALALEGCITGEAA